MNVLLTCAGRRNYLVEFFKEALDGSGKVFTADASAFAPAMQESDGSLIVPQVNSSDYVDCLIKFCLRNDIEMIVPLNDLELPVLSRNIGRFLEKGIFPVVADEQAIAVCFDKWETVRFAEREGINVPATYYTLSDAQIAIDEGKLDMPVVIKPRWGSASIGIEYAHTVEEMTMAYNLVKAAINRTMLADVSAQDYEHSILIQKCIRGQEYGLDVINDLNGKNVAVFVKKKIAMRAGETDRAETVSDENLERIGALIGKALGHIGNLDVDILSDGQRYYLLELNPRFGGGYPFSHIAGANVPAALIAWKKNAFVDPSWLKVIPGIAAAKCDRLVVINRSAL